MLNNLVFLQVQWLAPAPARNTVTLCMKCPFRDTPKIIETIIQSATTLTHDAKDTIMDTITPTSIQDPAAPNQGKWISEQTAIGWDSLLHRGRCSLEWAVLHEIIAEGTRRIMSATNNHRHLESTPYNMNRALHTRSNQSTMQSENPGNVLCQLRLNRFGR